MNELYLIATYVAVDEICETFLDKPKYNPKMTRAEIIWVAIIAAKYFQNHLERALVFLGYAGFIPRHRQLSISRFNRQLHQNLGNLEMCTQVLMEVTREGELFIIDSMPMPVCKRKRARRCHKVEGRLFCGFCAAKDEKFFGWRLHLICDPEGIPAQFTILPASLHDLTPVYELTYEFREGAKFLGDKGYNDQELEQFLALAGMRLIPIRRVNMKKQHDWVDDFDLRDHRKTIETVNSQLESMGINRLKATTNNGFYIKTLASLVALWATNTLAN
jgi:hypothetical protein